MNRVARRASPAFRIGPRGDDRPRPSGRAKLGSASPASCSAGVPPAVARASCPRFCFRTLWGRVEPVLSEVLCHREIQIGVDLHGGWSVRARCATPSLQCLDDNERRRVCYHQRRRAVSQGQRAADGAGAQYQPSNTRRSQ